ncbi:hypothetical protein RJT34_13126 [Clitoria ternatea]|uniref:MYND-type domain-containing protein n=1 Tax=Clitoria ternatea TaxID=43366 RepID=A0AAN9PL57_CLITE
MLLLNLKLVTLWCQCGYGGRRVCSLSLCGSPCVLPIGMVVPVVFPLTHTHQAIMRRPFKRNNFFHALPDDLLVTILSKLASTSSSPSDFITVLFTCKRFKDLATHRLVLSKVGVRVFAIKPKNWSENAHRFLKHCVNAGNLDACYTLGMIRFYCLQNRRSGLSLLAKAAMKQHAPSLYSLAVIQFNGSGGGKRDKDLRAGVALSARASLLGHIDALRELGHCLQDGYGVRQNIVEGRRLLVKANVRELACVIRAVAEDSPLPSRNASSILTCRLMRADSPVCPLLSDYGYNVAAPEVQPANWFLREWFESGRGKLSDGLRLCANIGCGRPETRPHEFRRCSVCGKVNYCSRGCQALDWKLRHKMECSPVEAWGEENQGEEEMENDEVIENAVGG